MPRDKRQFLRMNSDDSPLAVPNGDALFILNCRVYPTHVTTTPGNTLIPETLFTSTQPFTAICPNGTVGAAVTRTATAKSYESQSAADAKALAAATQLATAALVCTAGSTPGIVINSVQVVNNTVTVNATASNTASAIEYSIGGAFQSSKTFTNVSNGTGLTATARLVNDTTVSATKQFSVNFVVQDVIYSYFAQNSGSGNISVFGGISFPEQVTIDQDISLTLGVSGDVNGSGYSQNVTLNSPKGYYAEALNAVFFDPQSNVTIGVNEASPAENTLVTGTPNNTTYRLKYVNQTF